MSKQSMYKSQKDSNSKLTWKYGNFFLKKKYTSVLSQCKWSFALEASPPFCSPTCHPSKFETNVFIIFTQANSTLLHFYLTLTSEIMGCSPHKNVLYWVTPSPRRLAPQKKCIAREWISAFSHWSEYNINS